MELFSINVNCIPLFYVKSSIRCLPETPLKNKNSVDMSRYALRFYVVYYVGEEDSWESLGLKRIKSVHPKGNQLWIFIGRSDAEATILWPLDVKNWLISKDLMLGKIEGRRRGWQRMRWLDGKSPTQWTWVWVNSGSWWWTGKPGVLQSMGSQRVGHDWAAELTISCRYKTKERNTLSLW